MLGKLLKKYFVPHEDNDHKPHFLRENSIFFIGGLVLLLFALAFLQSNLISTTGFLANIFPSVLTDLANGSRTENGLSGLRINPVLTEAARLKAEDMARIGYFAHTSPEGITPWFWFQKSGYIFTYAGENLAIDFSDSYDINKAWLASPGHRANILNKNFTEIGIATAKGTYNGRSTIFVVELFGKPSPVMSSAKNLNLVPAPSPQPVITEPTVAGAKSEQVKTQNPKFEVESENEMFIAVKNSDQLEEGLKNGSINEAPSYASPIEMAASSPKTIINYVYLILAIIIISSLILAISIELEKQHPRHILYGVSLLLLIAVLLYFQTIFFPQTLII